MMGMWLFGVALAGGAYDLLKLRDGAGCAGLEGPGMRDELIALAEGDVQPGYVSIRAAECLISEFPGDALVVSRAAAWVGDPERAGLAIVVAAAVDGFAVEDGVTIARAAVAGPLRERLSGRLLRSGRVEVRKVVDDAEGVR